MQQPMAVVFGAGKLAGGLLGPLLSRAGFRIVYVARRPDVIAAINRDGGFAVQVKSGSTTALEVRDCSAIPLCEAERVVAAVTAADAVFTAVGIDNLSAVTRLVAAGLWRRSQQPGSAPLNVIACENLPGAGQYLRHLVLNAVRPDAALAVQSVGGFSAGLTRRIMTGGALEAGRLVYAIDQCPDLLVDAEGLRSGLPEMAGVGITEDFSEMVMRKLFTVNCAQAVAAYLGHREQLEYVHEAACHPRIAPVVEGALRESAAALIAQFPAHAREIRREAAQALRQISNPRQADTIRRIAKDPRRKLSPRERLAGPARLAICHGMAAPHLTRALAAALSYDAPEDAQAVAMQDAIAREGVERVLTEDCGLLPHQPLARAVKREYFALLAERAAPAPAALPSLMELMHAVRTELAERFDTAYADGFVLRLGELYRLGGLTGAAEAA